jgi:hypothetical protein
MLAQMTKEKVKGSSASYKLSKSEHSHKNLWILKPTGFNRGVGIHLFNSVADMCQILWTHYRILIEATDGIPLTKID